MTEALLLLELVALYTTGFFVALCQTFGYYADKGEDERFAFYRACDIASLSWFVVPVIFFMGLVHNNKVPWRWYWK